MPEMGKNIVTVRVYNRRGCSPLAARRLNERENGSVLCWMKQPRCPSIDERLKKSPTSILFEILLSNKSYKLLIHSTNMAWKTVAECKK
jgi:hypothetical protein